MAQTSQVNSVNNIKALINQNKLLESLKIELKKYEPPRPDLTSTHSTFQFNTECYQLATWLCGCPKRNMLFCYICLLANTPKDSNEDSNEWVDEGVKYRQDLKIKIKEHERSSKHLVSSLSYILIGNKDLVDQLSREHLLSVTQHNKQVLQNRYVLSKLIECVRYNTNYESEMKAILKECNSRTGPIFSELLQSVYEVCLNVIRTEIAQTSFLSVEIDEANVMGTSPQLIFIVRYELRGQIHERFVGFVTPANKHATGISEVILCTLQKLGVDKTPDKFICYSYDGFLTVHTRNWGIQLTIHAVYPIARFVHSYAHNPEMIIEHLAIHFKDIKLFFAQLESCSEFFSHTEKVSKLLNCDCKFSTKGQVVNTLSVNVKAINACLDYIIDVESEQSLVGEAATIKTLLTDYNFNYWLDFFWKLLPHCNDLFSHLQHLEVYPLTKIQRLVDAFKEQVRHIRCQIERKYAITYPFATVFLQDDTPIENGPLTTPIKQEPQPGNYPEYPHQERMNDEVAKKICGLMVEYVDERFCQMPGLAMAALVPISGVPVAELAIAANVFKLDKLALKNELKILCKREEFGNVAGALVLLQYFYENDLMDVFPETFKLLKICCTMPVTTSEPGRCFATLARSRDFFKIAQSEENLDVLGMCWLEKDLMKGTPNFCDMVIDHFCVKYKRQADFEYKEVC
ncbi:hypothetical protein Zmor_015601 [Zophobas morio]|uniref:Uncharacterized protein n=1 Tax=Zophobas morio TaxID=2755281 RepID=A0AA38IIF5_9CUCU|nr:hypothetical protein Zmor_015601 [Zophobas morio]